MMINMNSESLIFASPVNKIYCKKLTAKLFYSSLFTLK
ncbi:hypothetical protein J2772_001872 [Chryseobacterium jejuense]|nr:hypothetical protein [Chryseobacterium jejuense]